MTKLHPVRVWDLPTRLFHWLLAASIVGLVVSAKLGGNAMVWHFRFGYVVLTLLLFRLVWGVVGGRWSRFVRFIYAPRSIAAYLRGRAHPDHLIGHTPLGALSVFALLGILALQVATGLFADDEIAFAGPLTRFASAAQVSLATGWHKNWGQYVVFALVGLHIAAVLYYVLIKRHRLIRPMVFGDRLLDNPAPSSRDDAVTRLVAAGVLALCAAAVWAISGLRA